MVIEVRLLYMGTFDELKRLDLATRNCKYQVFGSIGEIKVEV